MKLVRALLLVALFSLPAAAQDTRVTVFTASSAVTLTGPTPATWSSINNKVWIFRPERPNNIVALTIQNINTANAYTFTLQTFQTADPLVADYSNNVSRWTQTPCVNLPAYPTGVTAFRFPVTCTLAAAQVAVRFTAVVGPAPGTDTAIISLSLIPDPSFAGVFAGASDTPLIPGLLTDTLGLYVQGTVDEGAVQAGQNPLVVGGVELVGGQARKLKFDFDAPILFGSDSSGDMSLGANDLGFQWPVGVVAIPQVLRHSDVDGMLFSTNRLATDPVAGDFLNISAAALVPVYFDRVFISCTVACTFTITITTTAGVTCTVPPVVNNKPSGGASGAVVTHTCTTDPGALQDFQRIFLAANSPFETDLTGIVGTAGSGDGISIKLITGITGMADVMVRWLEQQ